MVAIQQPEEVLVFVTLLGAAFLLLAVANVLTQRSQINRPARKSTIRRSPAPDAALIDVRVRTLRDAGWDVKIIPNGGGYFASHLR